jgi:hypothetical protein
VWLSRIKLLDEYVYPHFPCLSVSLRGERPLVIDRVEGILGQPLDNLVVAVPHQATRIRFAGRIGGHVYDLHAGRSAEGRAGIDTANVGQVYDHSADRFRRADLIAAQRRIAEVDIQAGSEHLRFEHWVH